MKFRRAQITKQMANILTGCRIAGSILLLGFPLFSVGFYTTYLLCGFSDMIDGTIARRTNSCSSFGSRLDTIADFGFLAASMIKLWPVIPLPGWMWIWIGMIAVIKIGNIIWAYVSKRGFVPLHTMMNKITGLLLFLLPLTLGFAEVKFGAAAVCFAATIAAVEEWIYITKDKPSRNNRAVSPVQKGGSQ